MFFPRSVLFCVCRTWTQENMGNMGPWLSVTKRASLRYWLHEAIDVEYWQMVSPLHIPDHCVPIWGSQVWWHQVHLPGPTAQHLPQISPESQFWVLIFVIVTTSIVVLKWFHKLGPSESRLYPCMQWVDFPRNGMLPVSWPFKNFVGQLWLNLICFLICQVIVPLSPML